MHVAEVVEEEAVNDNHRKGDSSLGMKKTSGWLQEERNFFCYLDLLGQ